MGSLIYLFLRTDACSVFSDANPTVQVRVSEQEGCRLAHGQVYNRSPLLRAKVVCRSASTNMEIQAFAVDLIDIVW
jgi:hypothetical protein